MATVGMKRVNKPGVVGSDNLSIVVNKIDTSVCSLERTELMLMWLMINMFNMTVS